jgi:hypothetical protein
MRNEIIACIIVCIAAAIWVVYEIENAIEEL